MFSCYFYVSKDIKCEKVESCKFRDYLKNVKYNEKN